MIVLGLSATLFAISILVAVSLLASIDTDRRPAASRIF